MHFEIRAIAEGRPLHCGLDEGAVEVEYEQQRLLPAIDAVQLV